MTFSQVKMYGGHHRIVLLLLAMLTGYPGEATEIFCNLLEQDHSETWWDFIDSFKSRAVASNSSSNSTTEDHVSEAEVEHWQQLLKSLAELRYLIKEKQSCADFVEWVPRVARYSYQSRSVLSALQFEERKN